MLKRRIMAPGPTEVPPEALAAAAQPILHHRTEEFRAVFKEVSEKAKIVFQTSQPVLTFAGTGSGGLEATIQNLTMPGDTIVVISGGAFGERWAKIGTALGRKVERIEVEWGQAVDPSIVKTKLANLPEAK